MTGAALALALALLVLPPSARPRLVALQMVSHARQRIPVFRPPGDRRLGAGAGRSLHRCAGRGDGGCHTGGTSAARTAAAASRRGHGAAGRNGRLVGELRVGAHRAAFDAAATEVQGAVGVSLAEGGGTVLLGADVAAGLHKVAGRSTTPSHWEPLAVSWHLAHGHGLAIAAAADAHAQRESLNANDSSRVNAWRAGARTTGGRHVAASSGRWGRVSHRRPPARVPAVPAAPVGGLLAAGVTPAAPAACCGRTAYRSGYVMSLASLLLAAAVLITAQLSAGPGRPCCADRLASSGSGHRRRPAGRCFEPRRVGGAPVFRGAGVPRGGGSSLFGACAAVTVAQRACRSAGSGRRSGDRVVQLPDSPLDNHAEALLRLARRSASSGTASALVSPSWPRNPATTLRPRRSGSSTRVGADRRAAGPVLSADVSVLGHRPGRCRVGRRCAGAGPDVRADCPPAVSRTGRGPERDSWEERRWWET